LFGFAGCHAQPSGTVPTHQTAAAGKHGAAGGTAVAASAAPDRSGTLEERLARLEDAYARDAEALEFLNKVYAQQKAQQDQQDRDEPAPDAVFAVNIADDVTAGQVDGPATAAVTIIKAFDFACPYCQRMASTLDDVVKDYGGKVRVVYMNLVIHAQARPAHLASCAAAKQGKYKQFKAAFWDKGFLPYAASQGKDSSPLEEPNILAISKDLGLDTGKLKADMASPACAARIDGDMQELAKFHVSSTPTFFINGKHQSGAMPAERLREIVDEQLKAVAASGVPAAQYYSKVVLDKGEKQFRSKMDPPPADPKR
jgi:protein-disulfide isomerase